MKSLSKSDRIISYIVSVLFVNLLIQSIYLDKTVT